MCATAETLQTLCNWLL